MYVELDHIRRHEIERTLWNSLISQLSFVFYIIFTSMANWSHRFEQFMFKSPTINSLI